MNKSLKDLSLFELSIFWTLLTGFCIGAGVAFWAEKSLGF